MVELVLPPPANPPAIVLSMWHTTLLPSHWDVSFSLLGLGLLASSRPYELDVSYP